MELVASIFLRQDVVHYLAFVLTMDQVFVTGYERARLTDLRRKAPTQEPWQVNQFVCPPILCGHISASTTGKASAQVAGSPFFEGDIVLDQRGRIHRERGWHQRRRVKRLRLRLRLRLIRHRRSIVRPITRLWPFGIVPYAVDQGLGKTTQRSINEAMRHIENYTCIRFRPRTRDDKDYIFYINQPGCWSSVGRQGALQYIGLGVGCDNFGTALHETAHALGFWHEQSRHDRDKYVDIVTQNIAPSTVNQFGKRDSSESTSRGFAYDYESIMHYGARDFSINARPTLKVKGIGGKLKFQIGQRKRLSDLDIAQLRDMYHCNEKDAQSKACREGWVKRGRSCYHFAPSPAETFGGADRQCRVLGSRLVHIESESEDAFLKSHLIHFYVNHTHWRTGGRRQSTGWVWHGGRARGNPAMIYTAWAPNHPGNLSALLLVRYDGSPPRFVWRGARSGTDRQPPRYTYPYICETKAKVECVKSKRRGQNYRGTLSYTRKGVQCQRWTSRYPHNHKYLRGARSVGDRRRNGLGEHNYCRNPDHHRARPWCYTTLTRTKWQYCDIEICKEKRGHMDT